MPTAWNIGDTILDLYRVSDRLGEGGFGQVYKVRHTGWNIDLAAKIPKPEIVAAAGGVEEFEREAETWVNLGLHPHTVSCYYVRRIDTSPVVFAEYVAGGSLYDWIANRQLYAGGAMAALQRLLDLAIQFAWGLHYAHEQGLIHQDVKPANVMMTPAGAVKVTDFGLANPRTMANILAPGEASSGEDYTMRVSGSGAMTPAYCSPEQANRDILTRRTDLWSWALSVLEMFQGDRTWGHGTFAASALENYLEEGSADPQLPRMPMSVAELLQRCFQYDPEERPHDLLVVARQLQEIYQQETGEIYPRQEPQAAKDAADSLNNRAVSLFDLGKQEEALQVWDQALQVQPHHLEATYNRGLVLWRSARIDDANLLRILMEARNSHSGDWRVDYFLALVNLERDDCEWAIAILKEIQAPDVEQEKVQAVLKQTRERFPQSRRLLHTFTGHTMHVRSVCLSADGRLALSGSFDQTLKLWEVATGQCLRTFTGHTRPVDSACLSADGRFALSGSSDNTLKLWEVATGQCLRTFTGHGGWVNSVGFNTDSRFALSGSDDYTLKLWSVATGQCLRTFTGHTGPVNSACLSADGRFALSGSRDYTMKLWSVATGQCLRTFTGHGGGVNSVGLNTDGRFALSGSDDDTMKLWEVVTGKCLRTFTAHISSVSSVCLNTDGRFALSGSWDYTLKLWEVATGKCLRTFPDGMCMVQSTCLSADGRLALSGGDDNTIKLWEFRGGTNPYIAPMQLSLVLTTETFLYYERELAQARTDLEQRNHIAAAQHIQQARSLHGYNRHLQAFNLWVNLYVCLPRKALLQGWENAKLLDEPCLLLENNSRYWVKSVCLSVDGRLALSRSNCTLKLWELATGQCLRNLTGHQEVVNSVSLSADTRFALSGSWDYTLKLWEVATGQCLHTFTGHTNSVDSVSLSADSRFALSGSSDNTLKLWSVATGQCLRTFTGHTDSVNSVSLSADSRFALSGSSDNTLKLWSVATGQCLRTFTGHTGLVNSVSLSADSRFALSGSSDNTLKLWSVETGQCLRTFTGHTWPVNSACWSADSRFALSGSSDNTLKLWSVATGQCLHTFTASTGYTIGVFSVCWSADGRFALSGSSGNTIKLWNLDWELEERLPADWDEGARPYLENFLVLHTPYAAALPTDREPTEEETTLALTRSGIPTWTEEDFQNLLYTLGCAGYGWLRPEGIKQQLEAMAANGYNSSVSPHPNPSPKLGRGAEEHSSSPTPTNKRSPVISTSNNRRSPITWTPTNKRSPITSTSAKKRASTTLTPKNSKQLAILIFWGLYSLLFMMAIFLNLSFWATAILPVIPTLLLTWFWVRRSR